jgi:UDP-3-O-[3-hydroxymyristoyl] glucosamine N-acyltransferase
LAQRIPNVSLSVKEIASLVNGEVVGNQESKVHGLCPLDAPLANHLSFVRSVSLETLSTLLKDCTLSALLVPDTIFQGLTNDQKSKRASELTGGVSLILASDPAAALFSLVPNFYQDERPAPGVSPLASVDQSATVDPSASIGAFAVIGPRSRIEANAIIHPHVVLYQGVHIGARSVLHSGVVVREDCSVGADCIIHNGCIVGADGFGYSPDKSGRLTKIPQVGNVVIHDSVEIGANTCVDRATLGATQIGAGTKIDNLAQVGHNVRIGRSSIICGHVGIGGSSTIGDGVVIGGQSGVRDHIQIDSGVRVGGRSGVSNNLRAGDYLGYPAISAGDWHRQIAALSRIPKLLKQFRKLSHDEKGS